MTSENQNALREKPSLSPALRLTGATSIIAFVLYFLSPAISYLQVWNILPPFGLMTLYIPILGVLFFSRMLAFLSSRKVSVLSVWGASILLWITALQIMWAPSIVQAGGKNEFFQTAAKTMVLPWMLWITGEGFQQVDNRIRRLAIWAVCISLSLVTLYGFENGLRTYGIPIFAFKNYATNSSFNYLELGDSLAVTGLLLIGGSSRSLKSNLVTYVAIVALCLLAYSRTSFFLFLVSGGWLLSVRADRKGRKSLILLLLGLIFVILFAVLLGAQAQDRPFLQRMTVLMTDPAGDQSFAGRMGFFKDQLKTLKQYWLSGQFLAEWWSTKRVGTEMHNWLSFWVAYGIGPFASFVLLSLVIAAKTFVRRKEQHCSLRLALLVFGLMAIIASRSYLWPRIWFILSLCVDDAGLPREGDNGENSLSCPLECRV